MADCTCTEWGPNIAKVNAPLMLAVARNPNTAAMYLGVPFRYCPWCGQPLKDLNEPAESEKAKHG